MSRSVEAVVADMVEEAHREMLDTPRSVKRYASALRVPALVEALAELFEATDPYYEELNGVWAQHFGALSHARVSALKALGGEQVQANCPECGRPREPMYSKASGFYRGCPVCEGSESVAEQLEGRAELEAENRDLRTVLLDLVELAEEARGHYGIEECAGPGQPATNWDDIQDELRRLARQGRALVGESSSPTPTTEKGASDGEH